MTTWIKIGLRNLIKNKRRSFFTLCAVALGYAAVNVFGGFTQYLFQGLRESLIYAQAGGHLNIFREGYLSEGALDPGAYLLNSNEIARIEEMLGEDPRIRIITPQLSLRGLISNGDISTVFIANGSVPSDTSRIRSASGGMLGRVSLYDGRPPSDDNPYGIGVGSGLARLLGLGLEGRVILMAPTVYGQMNALDAEIIFTFDAGAEQLNDKMANVTLDFARSLYDTDGAERLVVLLDGAVDAARARDEIAARLRKAGLPVEIATWDELAPTYRRTSDMFNVIFAFVFVIVFVIVVLSVVNTISMSVFERIREIGTLRALGLKRRDVLVMFAAESGMLALVGSAIGVVLSLGAWLAIRVAQPTWVPPTITKRIPLEIRIVPEYLVSALLFMLLLAVVAAFMPARRAARMSIIDALGHV